MADNKDIEVNVRGVVPRLKGTHPRYGRWFLIDEDGDFSLDHTILATIWVVGGGCDGKAGVWNGRPLVNGVDGHPDVSVPQSDMSNSIAGNGGDGGYVLSIMNVRIEKDQTLTSAIAQANDKSGTSLDIGAAVYKCNQTGGRYLKGGEGGSVPPALENQLYADADKVVLSKPGVTGVETPYGYVGSSGGGGAACNGQMNADNGLVGGEGAGSGTSHWQKGTDAENYGCGGGGGAVCGFKAQGQSGGKGKRGCIIIAYTIEQKTLVVEKRYIKKCTTTKKCTTNYATSQNNTHCCTTDSSGCGCGSSSGNNSYSSGVTSANYTNNIKIGISHMSAAELMSRIQEIEAENLALMNQIKELESKLGNT